uniref:Glutamate-rich protein 2 n=1 Tax=Petromyzon marinus TaxID=7757 RepID=A0AAJ7X532_PETMA|nr:glutamate-rich protein 2 [Petromyzon marinus]
MATGKPSGAVLSRENCRMRKPGACIHNDGRCHISSPARQGGLQQPLKGKGAGGAAQGGGKQSEDGANANGNEEVEKEDDDEEEKRTAPLELMAEFLGAIMGADYKLARKLCEMILIFEPHNTEAKQYLPVIEARITQEVEASQHEDSSDEDDYEESDDDDNDDLDDDDDDENDDDSEEDEEEPFRRNALCLNLQQISIN